MLCRYIFEAHIERRLMTMFSPKEGEQQYALDRQHDWVSLKVPPAHDCRIGPPAVVRQLPAYLLHSTQDSIRGGRSGRGGRGGGRGPAVGRVGIE